MADERPASAAPRQTFSKKERLCAKKDITLLLNKGRYFSVDGIFRVCLLERKNEGETAGQTENPTQSSNPSAAKARLLISVPKRHFKRAVRRNLLKRRIREAYRRIEDDAACKLLQLLPDDLREEFERVLLPEQTEDGYLLLLIKAADKLSALIKCLEEEKAGNREFVKAEKAARDKLVLMKLPEVDIFLEEFIPAYACTLDEL